MATPENSLGGVQDKLAVNRLVVRIGEVAHGDSQELGDVGVRGDQRWGICDGIARHENGLRIAGGLLNALVVEVEKLVVECGGEVRIRHAHGLSNDFPDDLAAHAVIHRTSQALHARRNQANNWDHGKSKNPQRDGDLDEAEAARKPGEWSDCRVAGWG